MASFDGIIPQELTWTLSAAIFSAVLGMFSFGYNTGVINAPEKVLVAFISQVYNERTGKVLSDKYAELLWAVTVSIFCVGGMAGGICAGKIADFFGRKKGLLINNSVGIVGGLLMATSKPLRSIECLVLGRFTIGFYSGSNCALVPMYLSEIAPTSLRGALGIINQLGVTIGLLSSQIVGLPDILGDDYKWPYLLGITIVPAIVQLLSLPISSESPRYLLLTKKREGDARKALVYFRRNEDVDNEIREIKSEEGQIQNQKQYSVKSVIRDKQLRLPLLISIAMQFSQQLSGINAILYYSTKIFMKAGFTLETAQLATIGSGVIMVIVTIVSIPLIDRAGRRTLMLYGLGGMCIFSILFMISLLIQNSYDKFAFASIVFALAFVVFFAIGPGSIPWLITAELFSQGPRPAAMSIAVLVNWSTNFIVGLVYPIQQRYLQNFSFLPFTFFCAIFWIFTYKKVPETKNRSIEEITHLFSELNRKNQSLTESPIEQSRE